MQQFKHHGSLLHTVLISHRAPKHLEDGGSKYLPTAFEAALGVLYNFRGVTEEAMKRFSHSSWFW